MTSADQPRRDDEEYWRRPDPGTGVAGAPGGAGVAPAPRYGGPPRSTPPPPGWRVPAVINPPAPRRLPPQDHAAINRQESDARIVTNGVALIGGAIMIVLLLLICGRWMF